MAKGLPFHTFIVIKYKNNRFILQSFFGICGLHVNEDINIRRPTISRFNQLFGTDLPNSERVSAPIY